MKKTITFDEYLNACRIIGEDRDIEVDNHDSIVYCGEELTEEGRRHFAKALVLPMYQTEDGDICPCVISEDEADYDEDNEDSALNLAWEMLCSMAGYCSCEDYDRWFIH